jgi:hypothetical protein
VESTELAAREGIRALVARYNATGDRGRIDEMVALFSEDAILELPGEPSHTGRAAISEFFQSIAAGSRSDAQSSKRPGYIHHHVSTHDIHLEAPDRARGTSYFQVLTAIGLDHWGRYIDTYQCIDGHWLFARRTIHVDGRTPGSWAERREAERARKPER